MELDPETEGLLDLTNKGNGPRSKENGSEDDDDIQDWSIVASVSKRGQKDFEPLVCDDESQDLSAYDSDALNASRNMMFSALSKSRGTIVTLDNMNRSTIYINIRNTNDIFMPKARGKFLESMGHIDRRIVCHFNYEEVLYLVERGTCLARLFDIDEEKNAKYQRMLPLTLEAVYSLLIHDQEQLDRYLVYSILKRNGYIVRRHDEFDHAISSKSLYNNQKVIKDYNISNQKKITRKAIQPHPILNPSLWTNLLVSFSNWIGIPLPVKFLGSYFNFFTYLSWKLRGLRDHNNTVHRMKKAHVHNYYISFNVWKPMVNFKKKSPPLPDFQIVVVKAWAEFPRYQDIKHLIKRSGINPENFHRRINHHTQKISHISSEWDYSRGINIHNLKYNEQSITFAIVDNGIVNFANLSDCCFAQEGACWRDYWSFPRKRRGKGRRKKSDKMKSKTTRKIAPAKQ